MEEGMAEHGPVALIRASLEQIVCSPDGDDVQKLEEQTLPLLEAVLASEIDLQTGTDLERFRSHLLTVVHVLKSQKSSSNEENPSNSGNNNKLDSFSNDRIAAIEGTILQNRIGGEVLTFADVAGLKTAKQALAEALVFPFTHPHWYTGDRKPWRSVLLFGPPGTGKSRLAQAVAGEVQAVFYCVSSSDLVSSWSGQSEKLVRELFVHAGSQNERSVVFIDEIDSLCRQRSSSEEESSRRLKTELLVQIQQIQKSESNTYLLCATNCPWDLDAAFLRRFQKRIFIELPDKPSRIEILQKRMSKSLPNSSVDWDFVGDATEGLTGNDLADLAQEILFFPVRELQATKHWKFAPDGSGVVPADPENGDHVVITMEIDELPSNLVPSPRAVNQQDFVKAFKSVKRTVTEDMILKYADFNSGVY